MDRRKTVGLMNWMLCEIRQLLLTIIQKPDFVSQQCKRACRRILAKKPTKEADR